MTEQEREAMKAKVEKVCASVTYQGGFTEVTDFLIDSLDALRDLHDVQNGPPLLHREMEWDEAMTKAAKVLNTFDV